MVKNVPLENHLGIVVLLFSNNSNTVSTFFLRKMDFRLICSINLIRILMSNILRCHTYKIHHETSLLALEVDV